MNKYCLSLDLKDDAELIKEYERWHQPGNVPAEVVKSIRDAGITNMEIYRVANRLFMIMETDDTFDFDRKAMMDNDNPHVQEWEKLMWNFQQSLPWAGEGEKWM